MRALLLAVALMGCSAQVESAVHDVGSDLSGRCGWYQDTDSPVAGDAACHVYVAETREVGMLPAGADPCSKAPLDVLRVEAGDIHSDWHRFGQQGTIDDEPCGN